MSLIDGVLALLSGIESDAIAVHEERCISVRNRNADCLRCVEACTSGALSLRGNELVVEPERCIGCGTCATACPTCAIELRNPTDEELTAQLKRSIVATKGHPVIVCETALAAAGVANADAVDACVVPSRRSWGWRRIARSTRRWRAARARRARMRPAARLRARWR